MAVPASGLHLHYAHKRYRSRRKVLSVPSSPLVQQYASVVQRPYNTRPTQQFAASSILEASDVPDKVIKLSQAIQDITMQGEHRGMTELQAHLSPSYMTDSALFLLKQLPPHAKVGITTGFYILSSGAPETDGPPGAAAVAYALQALGHEVVFITDECSEAVVRSVSGSHQVLIFPMLPSAEAAKEAARKECASLRLDALISVERAGILADGTYRNMHQMDMSAFNAPIDLLFAEMEGATVGIGDGGNEIGMGKLFEHIPTACPSKLPQRASVTSTTHLIVATTSNWGAYGLATALSVLSGRDLLISPPTGRQLVRKCLEAGAVDGVTGKAEESVDGMPLEDGEIPILKQLHACVMDFRKGGHD